MNITDGQKLALVRLVGNVTDIAAARYYILSKMVDRNIEHTSELTLEEWRLIRNEAYPNWYNDDWSISDKFLSKLQVFYDIYETEIMGQKKLF
jgi:hypothetical protein